MTDVGMGAKTTDAFRTISEVSDQLHIPQSVLRFWETRFSQIRPMKRTGGRRYYRPEDVALVRAIQTLLYGQGYTIKGVQRILKEQGAREVIRRHGEGAENTALLEHRPALLNLGEIESESEIESEKETDDDARRTAQFFIAEAQELLKEIEDCIRLLRAARR